MVHEICLTKSDVFYPSISGAFYTVIMPGISFRFFTHHSGSTTVYNSVRMHEYGSVNSSMLAEPLSQSKIEVFGSLMPKCGAADVLLFRRFLPNESTELSL